MACDGVDDGVCDWAVVWPCAWAWAWAWAAAAAYADDSEAPETAPLADVDTLCTPERARKAERKLEKNGLLLVMMFDDVLLI